MALAFPDFADYDGTFDLCECGGIVITPGAASCKSCAQPAPGEDWDRVRNHKVRQFWLSPSPQPDPVASYVRYLQRQVARAVRECRDVV